jgi:ABC-2 type transport system permease protein
MVYHIDLYLTYFRLTVKSWWQYRADFAISIVASMLHDGSTLIFLSGVFANVRQLEGWSFHEMLLIWGLMVLCRNLANSLFDVPHRIHFYIWRGTLDRLLVRPPALLLQIAGESGLTLPALGRVLVAVAAVLAILPGLQLPWWAALYLPTVAISGALIMFSAQLILACLNFWFTNALSVLTTLTWMSQFGEYPVTIFTLPLRFLFTWVLPYAMMGFYPAAFLLRGDEYRLHGLLAPLMGLFLFCLSLLFWRVSLRRYQSTGS